MLSTWLKRGLFTLVGLVALVAIAFVSLIVLIDPNDWKPEIEKVAAEQGYELKLTGDIEWQLFPRLGLSLGELSLRALPGASQNTNENLPPLLSVNRTSVAVALRPLLARQVQVDHVTIDQPVINLDVDKNGNMNIASIPEAAPAQTDQPAAGSESFDIAVQTISVNEAQLHYHDAQTQQTVELNPFTLNASDVNNKGTAFPLSLSLTVAHETFTQPLTLSLDGDFAFNQIEETLALTATKINAQSGDAKATIETTLSAYFGEDLSAKGQLKLDTLNPRQWMIAAGQTPPETQDPNALTALSFSGDFTYAHNNAQLKPFKLVLDDTNGNGELTIKLPSDQPIDINATLALTQLNLDNYLAPTPEEGSTTTAAAPTAPVAAAEDTPLPLESLHAANANLTLTLEKLIASGLTLTAIDTNITGVDGLWSLNKLNAGFYQGRINANAKVDARDTKKPAAIQISSALKNVSVLPLLKDLAEIEDAEGTISAGFEGNTSARTSQDIMNNLVGNVTLDSQQLRAHGLNLEQYYCEMAHQLDDQDRPVTEWPTYSDVTSVVGKIGIDHNAVTINQFNAQASNLEVAVTGGLNLQQQDFGFRFPLRLVQAQTSPKGCLVESNFLLQRSIDVVRCNGSLATLDLAKQCGVDTGAIADLGKQAIRYNANKKIDPKKQEIRESAKDKLRDSLGLNEEKNGAEPAENTDTTEKKEEKKSSRDLLKDLLR